MNLALVRGRNVTTHANSGEAFSKGAQRYMLYDNYTIRVDLGRSYAGCAGLNSFIGSCFEYIEYLNITYCSSNNTWIPVTLCSL